MDENEKYVRDVWENIRICSQPKTHDHRDVVYWWVIANGKGPLCDSVYSSEQGTWSAAAEFTRDRMEQVRQVREEIEMMENPMLDYSSINYGFLICDRILSRLESELSRLTAGMRPEAVK